ncbi:MFS transporter, DHA1 family, inner membrane transport protein [Devosia lucknowensis]|uniref:MFS transporter, DHA1 family, inner membrane transport protein n=1 Tax=Devosia lucknowensis TaxID=1096929 RepID=A0A1Y6FA53_9HYPH|nr:MFS transporter [Devosia lucknowensis]SMQ70230.1 MFS transporter, DHA1 family, inner membrane transport protein [Devosia lucknowensis]
MPLSLLALFLAAFTFGTAEFVIAGLLPEVALGLNVSIPVAGYLVSGYAMGIAVGGPLLAILTKKMNRKRLVVLLGLGFSLGQFLCAVAPDFELLFAARIVVSVLHGTYFGIAFILATSIVPPERRGFAMAMILAGLTVSNVLGVPGGTAIGNVFGWRATFWCVGFLGLAASVVLAMVLPAHAGAEASRGSFRREFLALGRQQVYLGFIIAILVMIGQYSLFTYIAPLLRDVTGLPVEAVPVLLLLYGAGATVGVFLGGRLADWRLMPSLIAILSLQAMLFLGLHLAAPYPVPMSILIVLWGGATFAFGSPLQSRMLMWAADAPNLTAALIPSGFNIGIAIGAVLGAVMLDAALGYRSLPLIGAGALTLAVILAIWSGWLERRASALPPGALPATAG